MKKLLFIFSLLATFTLQAQIEDVLPKKPSPPRLVNDLTGSLLSAAQVEALEQKLKLYDDSTSNQFTIVVVESLEGYSPDEYAMELGRKWGVGNKEFNNGVVILISTGGGTGNRKVAIATGYGLEGAIPDVTTKSIIDNNIIPNFKESNYYRGLDEGIDELIKAAAGRYKAPEGYGSGKKKGGKLGSIIVLIIILLIIFAGNGGKGGSMMSRRGFGGFFPIGGGGWSSGGGGGGGGGFGGFGGGSFGGGGSSGSW